MSMIEAFTKNIPLFSFKLLDECTEQWLGTKNGNTKSRILLALINEKLNRYEQEY